MGVEGKKVIMGLYEINCVKLDNCKAPQNLKTLSFNLKKIFLKKTNDSLISRRMISLPVPCQLEFHEIK